MIICLKLRKTLKKDISELKIGFPIVSELNFLSIFNEFSTFLCKNFQKCDHIRSKVTTNSNFFSQNGQKIT